MPLPNTTPSTIRIQRMLTRPPHVEIPKMPAMGKLPRIGHASGGIVDSPAAPFVGPILTTGGGRTDDVPMHVPENAYVIPAWAVSHIGDGNTINGFSVLKAMFGAPWGAKGSPRGTAQPKMPGGGMGIPRAPAPPVGSMPFPRMGATMAAGGQPPDTGKPVPIMASGGEFVVSPDEVARRGGGDVHKGHKVLDAWVKQLKDEAAKTLKKLPGPAR